MEILIAVGFIVWLIYELFFVDHSPGSGGTDEDGYTLDKR